jgi:hypothetical protein
VLELTAAGSCWCSVVHVLCAQDDPIWICLKAHASYLRVMLQHSFTVDDILLLDKLIYEHQFIFEKACAAMPRKHSRLGSPVFTG